MGKLGEKLRAFRPTTRRLAQLYCALLYNAHIRGFVDGQIFTGKTKALCVPGLNCYSCPGAVGACPLGAMQNALASAGTRAGTYILGILLLFGIILGRTVCGWLCPMGLIQELLHRIPGPKVRKSRVTRVLSWLKYVILAVFAVALPLWYGVKNGIAVPAFCKYICPAGTLEGAAGLLLSPENDDLFAMLGLLFTRKFVILLVILLGCIFCYRAFCRFLCPLGAIYSLFSRVAVIGVRVDRSKCTDCGNCIRSCQMDVRRVGDRECIHCGECMAHCAAGAISVKCGKVTLQSPHPSPASKEEKQRKSRRGRILWGVLAVLLICALVVFNLPAPRDEIQEPSGTVSSSSVNEWASDAPVGFEEGQQMADFTVDLAGGGIFRLADSRGRVTVINLWATWCGPCVQELPVFSEARDAHPDVCVVAIHSPDIMIEEDVRAFVEAHADLNLAFAMGAGAKEAYAAAGGSTVLPQTVVLNARGEVIWNQKGRMTREKLEELILKAEESVF